MCLQASESVIRRWSDCCQLDAEEEGEDLLVCSLHFYEKDMRSQGPGLVSDSPPMLRLNPQLGGNPEETYKRKLTVAVQRLSAEAIAAANLVLPSSVQSLVESNALALPPRQPKSCQTNFDDSEYTSELYFLRFHFYFLLSTRSAMHFL